MVIVNIFSMNNKSHVMLFIKLLVEETLNITYKSMGARMGGGKSRRLPPPWKIKKSIFLLYWGLFCYFFSSYGGLFATVFFYCGGTFSPFGGLLTTFRGLFLRPARKEGRPSLRAGRNFICSNVSVKGQKPQSASLAPLSIFFCDVIGGVHHE